MVHAVAASFIDALLVISCGLLVAIDALLGILGISRDRSFDVSFQRHTSEKNDGSTLTDGLVSVFFYTDSEFHSASYSSIFVPCTHLVDCYFEGDRDGDR